MKATEIIGELNINKQRLSQLTKRRLTKGYHYKYVDRNIIYNDRGVDFIRDFFANPKAYRKKKYNKIKITIDK